ncbi:MAG: methionine synthase [Chloroflexi bacterium]|nr:methionine synthase [Chloroflexota bacterium]
MGPLDSIRTDVIGSLLRPDYLKEAYRQHAAGQLDADGLRAVQDRAVREAIALQEAVGLDVITDGEQRRLNFQDVFSNSVVGYAQGRTDIAFHEQRVAGAQPLRRFDFAPDEEPGPAVVQRRPVVERLRLVRNTPLEEYRFASAVATRPVKVTFIGPERIGQRWDRAGSAPVYADLRAFLAEVVAIEREIVRGLVDAGCRYVHIDAPGYTAYVDAPSLAQMRARGEDPADNLAASLAADNALIADFPGVTFGIHLCRGNQRSMWHREGSYDAIAEQLFNTLQHQRFLLEYDSDRAGGFEPLRFVPKGKVVVLGLISTKVPETPSVDALCRRIDEAARYLSLEQLAISTQCGFASDVVGNLITPDDQRRKLERVVEVARRVWG